jgi:uncharacterized protein YkwD
VAAPAAAQPPSKADQQPARVARRLRIGACAGANLIPRPRTLDETEAATLCLINRERALRGLRRLRNSRALDRSAAQHSDEMLLRDYFADTPPSGVTLAQRAGLSGFHAHRRGATLGEDIATAGGHLATPRSVVSAWMRSPEHRSRLLGRSYRVNGVGITPGMPRVSAGGWRGSAATYTDDLG